MAEGRPKAQDPLLPLAVATALGAVLLFAYGLWGWGVALVIAVALLLVVRADLRRRGEALTLATVRARTAVVARVLAVRSRGQMRIFRARREHADLEARRSGLFRELGEAVYGSDDAAEKAARQALDAVLRALGEKEREIEQLDAETEAGVKRVQEPEAGGGGPPGPNG